MRFHAFEHKYGMTDRADLGARVGVCYWFHTRDARDARDAWVAAGPQDQSAPGYREPLNIIAVWPWVNTAWYQAYTPESEVRA